MRSHLGRQTVRNAQCAEGRGYRKKRTPLCNVRDKDSRFVLPERVQTSGAYQLHERLGIYECIKFNDTKVRTVQTDETAMGTD